MSRAVTSSAADLRKSTSRFGRLVQSRCFPLIVAGLAVMLALPALRAGWILDDYYHRTVMLPESPFRELLGPPAEMFRFFRGDPVRTRRVMEFGIFPWWTDPSPKAEFLQVLTVLTHRLDPCTLEITTARGYIDFLLDRVFRSERRPMALGQEVRLTGMTVRATALNADGRPRMATFQFDVPLESDSRVWLCFRGKGFEPFSPPAVGHEMIIAFDWRAMVLP